MPLPGAVPEGNLGPVVSRDAVGFERSPAAPGSGGSTPSGSTDITITFRADPREHDRELRALYLATGVITPDDGTDRRGERIAATLKVFTLQE